MTGMPICSASFIAFLSGHASVTKMSLTSMYVSNCGFVSIPGGYRPANTFVPVCRPNAFTAFHPFSRLLTMSMSCGSYFDIMFAASRMRASIFCRFRTDSPSGRVL